MDHHNKIATNIPSNVPSKKPTTVSYVVTKICVNKSFCDKFIKVFNILLGLLVIKLSIIPLSARNCQRARKPANIKICVKKTCIFCFLKFPRYVFLSFDIILLFIYTQLLP